VLSPHKRRLADLPEGGNSPLAFAVSQRDQSTLAMVEAAVKHNQTLLAYQPIMHASSQTQVAFYEGLIRVPDATGRIIPAREFMGVVEDSELGRQIDANALRMGLRALQLHPELRLSINMSARSIGYKPWIQTLRQSLKRDAMLGERLILEISESSAMLVPELVVNFMDELQPHGVCFAMDQFGAGYTAFRYFKEFYFDIMKIDGQYIKGVAQNPDNRAIVAALISIAHHFDMLTVAERVETAEDAACLAQMGVDCLQGYYFAAPTVQPEWQRGSQKRRG
jgi:EAL domain-containing protein (putative c-di-GMP-specific phosphodiesterase class I)